jgi:hypothetical protein
MTARRSSRNWFDTLMDFVAANPKMSAAIAFELGVLAAEATKGAERSFKLIRRDGITSAPRNLVRALPHSFDGLKSLMDMPPPRWKKRAAGRKGGQAKAAKTRARKAGARKNASKSTRRKTTAAAPASASEAA